MIVNENIFRDVLRLFVWFPFRWLVLKVPVSWGIALLRAMGDIHYSFSRGKRELLRNNLSRLKGYSIADDEKCEKSVREYFRNHYIDHLFIFIFPRFGIREIEKFIKIEGLEFLDKALKRGKGVLLIHGHFGPVHLPLVVLARLGYRMRQIGFPTGEGLSWIGRNVAFRLRLKYEAEIPAEIIKADSFLRPAFKWLSEDGVIMITGDGTGTEKRVGRHEAFKFFGQPVFFPLGPAALARKTGAVVLFLFIVPGEKKLYKIIIEESIAQDYKVDRRIEDVTEQFIRRLEDYIGRYPGYMHFLDRFYPGGLIQDKEAGLRNENRCGCKSNR